MIAGSCYCCSVYLFPEGPMFAISLQPIGELIDVISQTCDLELDLMKANRTDIALEEQV